jgi:hypothetical protein
MKRTNSILCATILGLFVLAVGSHVRLSPLPTPPDDGDGNIIALSPLPTPPDDGDGNIALSPLPTPPDDGDGNLRLA